MIVKVGNIFYFIPIMIMVGIIVGLYFILKNKSENTKRIVIIAILFLNFALHFLKQCFPPYIEKEDPLHFSTFENICAASTLVFPFIFLFVKKNNVIYNYIFFIGTISGLLAFLYPTEVINKNLLVFDSIRFYFCHFCLLAAPLLGALLGLFRPNIKYIWTLPLFFAVHLLIVFVNEIVLVKTGHISSSLSEFFNREHRNNSFIFGVTPDMDGIKKAFDIFTPKFLHTNYFNIPDLDEFYFPILWIICPCYVFFSVINVIQLLPFIISDAVKKNKESKKENSVVEN